MGDQPKDIDVKIREMIYEFIRPERSIILAISTANVDLANSEALKIAREVDPRGVRTIGVLTKLDLMDKGTEHGAVEVIQGGVYSLRHGFVGVINRSQKDIDSKKSIHEALKAESDFFNNHPQFKEVKDLCGCQYLTKRLNRILTHHIRECIPDLKNKTATLLRDTQAELAVLGGGPMELNKNAILLQILNAYSSIFIGAIDGNNSDFITEEL